MSIKNFFVNLKEYLVIKKSPIHDTQKICPECDGTGYEDVFNECEECEGKGVVRKTYKEYVDSLPPRI
ncbi:hypothetical protein [Bacillus sp. NPDC060175]|uniref:hypothetical protein n=1 Tax=Bacillus sp. NPDC060175 TaxID=3347061 RepID=UPI00365487DD